MALFVQDTVLLLLSFCVLQAPFFLIFDLHRPVFPRRPQVLCLVCHLVNPADHTQFMFEEFLIIFSYLNQNKIFLIHFALFFFNNCVREIFADSDRLFVSKPFFSLEMSSSAFITRSMTPYTDKRRKHIGFQPVS